MLSCPHSCQKGLICRFWLKVVEWKFQNSLKESWNPKKCVVLSWASFWMKLSIAPARVGLGITSYLSIKTLANSFQDGMPRVAYLKVSFSIIFSGRLCLGRAVPKNKLFKTLTNFLNILLYSLFTRPLISAVLWLNLTVRILGFGHLDDWLWYIHLRCFPWIHNGAIPLEKEYAHSKMWRMFLQ